MDEIHDKIIELYTPLRDAIAAHGFWTEDMDIIPIGISRTGSYHQRTLVSIDELINPKEEPLDALTLKTLPKSSKPLLMELHTHTPKNGSPSYSPSHADTSSLLRIKTQSNPIIIYNLYAYTFIVKYYPASWRGQPFGGTEQEEEAGLGGGG